LLLSAMFGRLWNFAKRHKKKFIFSGIFAGGAYVAWRVLLPRLQEHLLQRLLKELAKEASGGGDTEESAAEKRLARFEHKQKVSDGHARRKLAVLRAKQNSHFNEEACTARVRDAQGREAKLEAFLALQVECVAKAASALYMLHLTLILHRVGFNIVGRELAGGSESGNNDGVASTEGAEADSFHAAFLQCLDHLHEDGAAKIAEAIRKAVSICMDRAKLGPQSKVSREELEKLLIDSCREADSDLLEQSKGAALLLPDGLNDRAPAAQRAEVKRLLDEARDYLDSPQFVQVFQVLSSSGARRLAEVLQEEIAGGAGAEGPWAMAKFNGALTKTAGALLDDDEEVGELGGAAFVRRFSEEPKLRELCEGLYFQGGVAGA